MTTRKQKEKTFDVAISELNSAINGFRRGTKMSVLIRQAFELSSDNSQFIEGFSNVVEKQFTGTKGSDPTRQAFRQALKRERDGKGYSRDNGVTAFDVEVKFEKGIPTVAVTQHKNAVPDDDEEKDSPEQAHQPGKESSTVQRTERELASLGRDELIQLGRDLIHQIHRLSDEDGSQVAKELTSALAAEKRILTNRKKKSTNAA